LEIAQFIQAEEIDPAVAGDDFGEGAVVLGFGELVHESGGEHVADSVASFGGGGAEPDQQVRLACSGVADQAQRPAFADPLGGGEGVDQGRVEVRVGGVVEFVEAFGAGEAGVVDASGPAAFVPVVALGQQQFGQEPLVGVLLTRGDLGGVGGAFADGGQAQGAAGGVDRDLDGPGR
jgi:hypothetical protein